MRDGSALTCRHISIPRLSLFSRWKWVVIIKHTSSRSRCGKTHHRQHPKHTTSTWTCSMFSIHKNSSLSSGTSISWLMEPQVQLHPFGLTTYVWFYGDRHWWSLMSYSLNMVVRPITTSSLYRRVYSSISFRSMRFPIKSTRWGAQCVKLEAWPSSIFQKGWRKSTTPCRSSQDQTPPRKWK